MTHPTYDKNDKKAGQPVLRGEKLWNPRTQAMSTVAWIDANGMPVLDDHDALFPPYLSAPPAPAIEDEEWRSVPGYEGLYEASSRGVIRSLERDVPCHRERHPRHIAAKELVPSIMSSGYLSVSLWRNGIQATVAVHRLMALVFLGPRPEGMQVNHKDGHKTNNAIANLEYSTPSENMKHAFRYGLANSVPGERNGRSKLTPEQVADIRRRYKHGDSGSLAREFGVSTGTIRSVARGDTWKS